MGTPRVDSPNPRRLANAFGVYYMGVTFEVAFLETILRDTRNQNPATLLIAPKDLENYVHTQIMVRETLDLVDLRGGNAITMGIPTDAVRARSHRHGRRTRLAFYTHPRRPDGIYYPSRLNQDENIAVYDRAVHKLNAGPTRRLNQFPELAAVLDRYRIAIA
ncbi:MAG TPA: RES family NAD+ phosphorylase [Candidatus Binataceae bacterium]|jgi:hypothetical protein|nr:RES family NAD+ phosphorylase [Candidatus Binataceae bacterium]